MRRLFATAFLFYVSVSLYAQQTNNTINGHAYVDLGLSVKWATCNVGATTPQEKGNLYAWGEIFPIDSKILNGYSFYSSITAGVLFEYITKYNYLTTKDYLRGTLDNKIALEPCDDVANILWKEGWRMPSFYELIELSDSCTWEWTELNGTKGFLVTSKIKGYTDNSIFLPAAGSSYMSEKKKNNNPCVCIWSSSLYMRDPYSANALIIQSNGEREYNFQRHVGISVRPVHP